MERINKLMLEKEVIRQSYDKMFAGMFLINAVCVISVNSVWLKILISIFNFIITILFMTEKKRDMDRVDEELLGLLSDERY